MKESILDVVICTYNREDILSECLEAVAKTVVDFSFNLIVVNNYHRKLSKETQELISTISNTTLINEPRPGLSIARNVAIKSGKGQWIAFLDDDALITENYIAIILKNIEIDQFACFGGHIESWWKHDPPRWLSRAFGSKPKLMTMRGPLVEGYNWGSNIVIKRESIEAISGFPENIGLKGSHLGYSAENIVQDKLRENGEIIGYDPDLIVHHLVLPHKHRMLWHIKSAYATGRDGRNTFPKQYGWKGFFKSMKTCFSTPARGLLKIFSKKDYFWENLILDFTLPNALLIGKLRSLI